MVRSRTIHGTLIGLAVLLPSASLSAEVTKVLHFPEDQCMGSLSLEDPNLGSEYLETGRDLSYPFGFDPKRVCLAGDWDSLARAQGDVQVPADRNLLLVVVLGPESTDRARLSAHARFFLSNRVTRDPTDLAGLAELPADSLYQIHVSSVIRRRDADRRVLEPLSRLTGLRVLHLTQTGITDAQMHHLTALQSLRVLSLAEESSLANTGLAVLKDLPALEFLDLDTNTTDTGLKHLGQLQNLRWLRLRTGRFWGPGLRELEKSPRLERLCLWGETGITDRLVSYIEGLTRLKSLTLWGTSTPLTDASLASIGKLTSLEELYFIRIARDFTESGWAHLKNLRRLRIVEGIGSPAIGAQGLGHLTALPELEILNDVELSADAIAVLPSFRNLKSLHFVGGMPPGGTSVPLVDISGLAQLAQRPNLEDLSLAGDRWDPEDLVVLEHLKQLRRLSIMDDVTDENLATIGTLKNLKHLDFGGNNLSKRGLNELRALTQLETLSVSLSWRTPPGIDETRLAWSSLKNLRTLSVGGVLLDDADLASVAHMQHLESLSLQNGNFSEAGLRYLQSLSALKNLRISNLDCPTGAGLQELAGLESLRDLTLQGRITDEALEHLTGLPSLWSLWIITDEVIQPETVTRLRERLPAVDHIHVVEPPRFDRSPVQTGKSRQSTPTRSSGSRRRQSVPRSQRRRQ